MDERQPWQVSCGWESREASHFSCPGWDRCSYIYSYHQIMHGKGPEGSNSVQGIVFFFCFSFSIMIHVNLFFFFFFFFFFTFHEVFWWIGARGYSCLFGFYGCAFYFSCVYIVTVLPEKKRKEKLDAC